MLDFLLTPNVDISGEGKCPDPAHVAAPVQRAIVSQIRLGIRIDLFQNATQYIERRKPLAPLKPGLNNCNDVLKLRELLSHLLERFATTFQQFLISNQIYFQLSQTGNMCGLFGKKEKVEPKYLIALIGVTGAGKSTFISRATGRKDIEISNSSSSCSYLLSCVDTL
jgi:hypothetical protein